MLVVARVGERAAAAGGIGRVEAGGGRGGGGNVQRPMGRMRRGRVQQQRREGERFLFRGEGSALRRPAVIHHAFTASPLLISYQFKPLMSHVSSPIGVGAEAVHDSLWGVTRGVFGVRSVLADMNTSMP